MSITVLLWIATKFNLPSHSRLYRRTLVFPGQSSSWSSASQTPASPITHPSLSQQCRQREWVFPDSLVGWYTPCWQHRRAPFKTTSGYFNREVLQDHIRRIKSTSFEHCVLTFASPSFQQKGRCSRQQQLSIRSPILYHLHTQEPQHTTTAVLIPTQITITDPCHQSRHKSS